MLSHSQVAMASMGVLAHNIMLPRLPLLAVHERPLLFRRQYFTSLTATLCLLRLALPQSLGCSGRLTLVKHKISPIGHILRDGSLDCCRANQQHHLLHRFRGEGR
jgi:hypothetical protein